MNNLRVKVLVVLGVFALFTLIGIYPVAAEKYKLPSPKWLQAMRLKLGLDLQGGVHLVLRVQTDDALRLQTEIEMERLREELSRQNIAVTNIAATDSSHFRVEGVPADKDGAFRTAAALVETDFERGSGSGGA